MHLKNISLTTEGLNIEFQNGAKDCFLIYGLEIIAKM